MEMKLREINTVNIYMYFDCKKKSAVITLTLIFFFLTCQINWIKNIFSAEYEKRFLFETTTSHFADRNLAIMEAAIKELGARVQQLENANGLEQSLSYRLDREFKAMQTELSHQRSITDRLNDVYFSKSLFFKINSIEFWGTLNINDILGKDRDHCFKLIMNPCKSKSSCFSR